MQSTLFPLIRKVHFFSAATIALLLCFYTMTAWFMEYGKFLPRSEHSETQRATLEIPAPGESEEEDAQDWALEAARELALPGRLGGVMRDGSGRWRADFNRVSGRIRLFAEVGAHDVELHRTRFGVVSASSRLHQLRGSADSVALFLWGLAVDVVSLILILFSLTGTYLWYVTDRDWLGFMLLFAGAAFVASSVAIFV